MAPECSEKKDAQHDQAKTLRPANPNMKGKFEDQTSEDFWSSFANQEPFSSISALRQDNGLQFLEVLEAEAKLHAEAMGLSAKEVSNNDSTNIDTFGPLCEEFPNKPKHMKLLSEDAVLTYRRNEQRMAGYEEHLAFYEHTPPKPGYIDYPPEEVRSFWQSAPMPAPELDWEQEYLKSISQLGTWWWCLSFESDSD